MRSFSLVVLFLTFLVPVTVYTQSPDPDRAAKEASAPARSTAGFVISTGREGGGYFQVGHRLKQVLSAQGGVAHVRPSEGSLENLRRLSDPDSEVNVGFTQADALRYYLASHPEFAKKLVTVDDWGKECVFIVARRDSGIETDRDIQKRNPIRIAILSPESGVAVTFSYMAMLEPTFKNTDVVYRDTMEVLTRLAEGEGEVDAVMLVQHPKARPPEMRMVLDNFDSFRFVQVDDRDLRDRLPDGSQVYTHEEITPKPMSGIGVRTICTKRLVVAAKEKLSPEQSSSLSQTVEKRWRDIYVTR